MTHCIYNGDSKVEVWISESGAVNIEIVENVNKPKAFKLITIHKDDFLDLVNAIKAELNG